MRADIDNFEFDNRISCAALPEMFSSACHKHLHIIEIPHLSDFQEYIYVYTPSYSYSCVIVFSGFRLLLLYIFCFFGMHLFFCNLFMTLSIDVEMLFNGHFDMKSDIRQMIYFILRAERNVSELPSKAHSNTHIQKLIGRRSN